MPKLRILLLSIAVCTIWKSVMAQTYSVESLEGKTVNIHITENVPGKSWYLAKVSCLTDSIFLDGYNGIKEAHLLNRNFLEIIYDTRGGSGAQMRNTLILSIKGNKINVSLLLESFGKAFGSDVDGSLYAVKFNIIGTNKSNLKLIARIYDRHHSNSNPKLNYLKNKKVVLNYDSDKNIFYSSYQKIAQSFTIHKPKTGQSNKQQINDSLPIIALDKIYYYFINGEWYNKDSDNNLFKDYYK
jgi:hypothetical protein